MGAGCWSGGYWRRAGHPPRQPGPRGCRWRPATSDWIAGGPKGQLGWLTAAAGPIGARGDCRQPASRRSWPGARRIGWGRTGSAGRLVRPAPRSGWCLPATGCPGWPSWTGPAGRSSATSGSGPGSCSMSTSRPRGGFLMVAAIGCWGELAGIGIGGSGPAMTICMWRLMTAPGWLCGGPGRSAGPDRGRFMARVLAWFAGLGSRWNGADRTWWGSLRQCHDGATAAAHSDTSSPCPRLP
jgi:hypothetical protein